MNTFEAPNLELWRSWLAEHHACESHVWLIFHKVHTGRPCISYADALDEALCYGWIDSLIKRLDDDRYARKFTPRKPDSKWSDVNRRRYAELEAAGRLAEPGRQRAPTENRHDPPRTDLSYEFVETGLRESAAAWANYEKLPYGERRMCVGWVTQAKHEETRQRRLAELIRVLEAGERLGLK